MPKYLFSLLFKCIKKWHLLKDSLGEEQISTKGISLSVCVEKKLDAAFLLNISECLTVYGNAIVNHHLEGKNYPYCQLTADGALLLFNTTDHKILKIQISQQQN